MVSVRQRTWGFRACSAICPDLDHEIWPEIKTPKLARKILLHFQSVVWFSRNNENFVRIARFIVLGRGFHIMTSTKSRSRLQDHRIAVENGL